MTKNENINLLYILAIIFLFINFIISIFINNFWLLFFVAVLDVFLVNIFFKKVIQKERKFSEDLNKFRLATDNASDHIVITDSDGIIIYANKAVKKITGYDPEEIINKKAGAKNLWGGLMPKSFYKKMWHIIKDEKKTFYGEITNKRKNGEKYISAVSVSPVLDDRGELVYFVGIERDVTKEKEIDKAKTEFVSLASHQLRTPLSAINWYTEMLLNGDAGKITKKQKSFLEEVYKGNKRMIELVNALLNVSRLEMGTLAISLEKLKITEIAKEILKEISILAKSRKIELSVNLDDSIPEIDLDKNLIGIVLQNLLSNAVKYTPEKGKVFFDIKQDDKNIIITIKDNGYGIPKEQQDKIFEKLFRAKNVTEKDSVGTGLGLYIVKTIIDNTGGSINFESEENKGTIFNIQFPVFGMKQKEVTN